MAANHSALPAVFKAANFAAQRHAGQRRKGAAGEPYINHLLEVAWLLVEESGGEDVELVVAGLLHDVVEDTETTREEVAREFGEDVAGLVMEVTDDKRLPKQARKDLQVQTAPHKTPRAQKLKAADKISNLRSLLLSPPASWDLARQVEYVAWSKRVIDGCSALDGYLKEEFYRTHAACAARYTEINPT